MISTSIIIFIIIVISIIISILPIKRTRIIIQLSIGGNKGQASVKIYSASGVAVKELTVSKGGVYTLHTAELAAGEYFIQVNDGVNTNIKKIIKAK